MYEGKNIHFSPLDNKPLCSYSAKVCKQRRLNGYSLCLRHVLEDPGAPFRQCLYQARNKQQCTNPIHKNNDAQFCTSHLQLLGLIPVGAKSCSKANREGKLIKNGLHSSGSPCQKDQLRNKTKSCDSDSVIGVTETQPAGIDPYMFSDVDPPKTSKSSPPLLSMVADVSGMSSCLTTICLGVAKQAVPQEPNRSIPISRLYPELVEKLESDRNKSHPRPKAARSLRTTNAVTSRNSQNRIKLKKCSSPSGIVSSVDSSESLVPASCLSTVVNQPVVLSVSSSSSSTTTSTSLSTPTYNSLGTKLDLTNSKPAVSSNSLEMKNAAIMSRTPWMLPMYEQSLGQQQTVPVIQTFSKAIHGLLNPVPLLKSSVQAPLTPSSIPQSAVTHPLFRSHSEPQRPPEKGSLLQQTPTITSPTVSQRLASLDLKLASTLASAPSLGSMQVNHGGSVVRETTAAASNSQPFATLATETVSNFIKTSTTANSDDAQAGSGSRIIHFVRPRSKVHRFSYKEAKSRIRRKCALKIYLDHTARVMENSNLLPTGVDSSDDDDDLDHELPWQRLWNDLSSDEGEGDFDLSDDVTSNIRRTKLQLLKSKMRRQFTQLQRCHEGNTSVRTRHRMSIDYLIASCRQDTQATVEALRSIKSIKPSNSSLGRSSDVHRLLKRPCLHRNDCDIACNSVALPYTNHCLKHIMYNVDQLLFGYCTAKFADKTQCCVPVFDIKHELPLCSDHMTKDILQENQDIKPKKQRKKTKPSALTRPPKKGKKKKCQRKTVQKPQKLLLALESCPTSSVDVSTCDDMRPPVDPSAQSSVSSSLSSSMAAQVSCLDTSAATATGACTLVSTESKDSIDDDALGSDLDVTFSPTGLPLDNDQATNFLDEHELHEMLNKMADEAFELSGGKNGCYPSSKEVEEEFVRVLVEATKNLSESKDVRLGQLSHDDHTLATLLPDGPNEDELTKQIADSLLNRNTLSPSGSVSDDQDNLNDLASSLTVHDLRSISQVMESSIMNQALDLCPAGITMPPNLHHNDGAPNNCISYLNGSGLLQQYPAQEHPFGTVSSSFPPIIDQSQLGAVDSHVRFPGLISFPLNSNGMLDSSIATSHLTPTPALAVPAPRFSSVLSSMLPLAALGMSGSRVVVSLNHGITSSQTMRPPASSYSGDDSFGQMMTFHSLPDIQTLMKQPWRLPAGDGSVNLEFRPNPATLSTASVPVNFPHSQFSYIPNFHPPQFLVSESKTNCSMLPKQPESEGVQTMRTALPETNAADLLCSANSTLSSLHKILNPQMPSTP